YVVHPVALTSMTLGALAELDISKKDAERAKNMFALGMLSWLYSRPYESTIAFLERKFAKRPDLVAANIAAFKAGWNFGETTEDFAIRYEVKPARMPAGRYRNVTGTTAVALELPLVVIDVQRAGPSTGMPTKTEQADLNMALFGRHGEAPVAVIAPKSPVDCFYAAIEAARIALTYRTPVLLLSDGYIAN